MTTLHEEQMPLGRKHSLGFIADENNEEEETAKYEDDKYEVSYFIRTVRKSVIL